MSKKSVFCIATSHGQTEQIVDDLRDAGFSNDDVSVLFPDRGTIRDFAYEKRAKSPREVLGGPVGGALRWLAGVGGLAIPGAGPFIAAGPVLAALSAAAMGTTIGGMAGGLVGMGIPELEARRYEGKVNAGNMLLAVHTNDLDEIGDAERIFEDAGAEDIWTTGEAAARKESDHFHTSV